MRSNAPRATESARSLDRRPQILLGRCPRPCVADPAAGGAEHHRRRHDARDAGGVVERAARDLEVAAGRCLARFGGRARPGPGRTSSARWGRSVSSASSQPWASAHSAAASRAPASIAASASASGFRRSQARCAAPATAVEMPGSSRSSPVVATPPCPPGSSAMRRAQAAAARPASRRIAIGVVPACAAWPVNVKRCRSMPWQPSTAAIVTPSASITGPCSMWSSRYEREALAPRRALGRRVDVHAVLGQDLAHRPAVRVVRLGRRLGSSSPANADEPNRLRPNREPSSSAQSTSDERARRRASPACARRTPTAAITPERAVEPAAVGNGVDVRADGKRAAAVVRRRGAPRYSRPRRVSLEAPISPRSSPRNARASSQVSVQATRCAPPSSEVRRASSRRSAITRSASIRPLGVKPRDRAGWPAQGSAPRRRRA